MKLSPATNHRFLKLIGLGKAGRFGSVNLFLIKFHFLTWSGQPAPVMFKTRADPNLLEVWLHRVENVVQADWMLDHTLNFHDNFAIRSAQYQSGYGPSRWLLMLASRISHWDLVPIDAWPLRPPARTLSIRGVCWRDAHNWENGNEVAHLPFTGNQSYHSDTNKNKSW